MTLATALLLALPLVAIAVHTLLDIRYGEHWKIALWDAVVQSLRGASFYMLLGPPIGATPYVLYALTRVLDNALAAGEIALFVIAMAYLFGSVPSFVTGLVMGGVERFFGPKLAALVSGLVGCATSVLWLQGDAGRDRPSNWALPCIAFAASGVLGYIHVRRRRAQEIQAAVTAASS